jgi:hypothetical protein
LNAIIPNLSKASYSCKKYPAFLNSNVSSFSGFSKFLSQKIRTAITLVYAALFQLSVRQAT